MTEIKAVIFDLDNTLLDFMKLKRRACEEAMSAMIGAGLEIDKKKGLYILYKLYDKYGIEHKEIFQEFLKKTIGKIDYKILAHGIVAYRRIETGHLDTYPGVSSTLLKLKTNGIKLGIVSDAPRMRAWIRLASLKLTDFFDVIVTFEDTKKKKPNKLPFELALKKLNVMPEQCLMVGDWPERDILGAKKLKIKTCFAKYGYALGKIKKVKADYIISSIKDILKITTRLLRK